MKYIKIIGMGLLLFAITLMVEMLVTLPFGAPTSEDPDIIRQLLVWEFLLSAIPAGLLTYAAARMMKLTEKSDLILASVVWTVIHVLLMLLIAVGNDRFNLIFGSYAFYVRLACIFIGPMLIRKKSTQSVIRGRGPRIL